uniref:FAD-dependent urate hydroxylase HpyO/Asp monooxygenase CreE-like FAD/NAD(P)-binding domain-containing protein n=1 Tax=Kitasatospora sp. NRRL F-6133 TaxID=1415539 RepID=U5YRV9_9ACTN|nr:hypothetical protein [Kitasatospora sp. NRRL F-6133]
MRAVRLAIIGGGPSCTYVMERLAATVSALPPLTGLDVHVFDLSGQFGAGQVHSPLQPRTSFLNRIVAQVAFAADETVDGADPLLDRSLRPTLYEWCASAFAETGLPEFDLDPEDWPKRYVHGLALRDLFERYLAILRGHPGVRVHLHAEEVVDLVDEDGRLRVLLADGTGSVVADEVLMITGHSWNRPERSPRSRRWAEFAARQQRAVFVPCAYPLEQYVTEEVAPAGGAIACAGMGLTAIDVVLHLTEGRGGTFTGGADGRLRYTPSGQEPSRIVLFGSAGLFTFARPYNAKEQNPAEFEHRGVFLTDAAVDRVRAAVGRPVPIGGAVRLQLDFERHIMPIVVLEMAQLYYRTLLGPEFGAFLEAEARPGYEDFLAHGGRGADADGAIAGLLAPVEAAVDRAERAVDGVLTGAWPLPSDEPWARPALARYLEVVHGPVAAAELTERVAAGQQIAARVAGLVSPTRHGSRFADNRFGWERLIRPLPATGYRDPAAYRAALLDFMDVDHRWAAQGNLLNPAKAAADGVWRDLRQVLARAVDFGGLTAASHRTFLDSYMRIHNRLCNGAALEVMEKIRALVELGLVDVSAGPGAFAAGDEATGSWRVTGPHTGADLLVDTLVDARVHPFDAESDVRPLYPNLLRRGLVRKWRNPGADGPGFEPGGLDLTERFHPVRADGRVDDRLTLLGPPSEGVMFFQLGALRPNQNHHVMQDVLCWVRDFWQKAAGGPPAAGLVTASTTGGDRCR